MFYAIQRDILRGLLISLALESPRNFFAFSAPLFFLERLRDFVAWILCAAAVLILEQGRAADSPHSWEKKWVRVGLNAYLPEEVTRAVSVVERAAAAGYNGVILSDTKTNFFWKIDNWIEEFRKPSQRARELGLEVIIECVPIGYSSSLLVHDPNLAAGYPVVNAPMEVVSDTLRPVNTAQFVNGDFETFDIGDQTFDGYFTDGPGEVSFVDQTEFHEGAASLRFEADPESGFDDRRVFQAFQVQPYQQYRVCFWTKMESLSARYTEVFVTGGAEEKELLRRELEEPDGEGSNTRIGKPDQLTLGWTKQSVAFNSLNHTEVEIAIGIWGATSGKFWIDELRVESDPLLNLVRRQDLPFELKKEAGGQTLVEDTDYEKIADLKVGDYRYQGDFDTAHVSPKLTLKASYPAVDGERFLISGYHAHIGAYGAVMCSLTAPEMDTLLQSLIDEVATQLNPDALFLQYDEVRSGGYEPADAASFNLSGEVLADHFQRSYNLTLSHGGGKPVFTWSDMFDPNHNAVSDYFQVNNSMAGSWAGLNTDVTVMNWNLFEASASLQFFDGLGNRQMIAAYYDEDVLANYNAWITAVESAAVLDTLRGVMFTTFEDNYNELENFAEVWWGPLQRPDLKTGSARGNDYYTSSGAGQTSIHRLKRNRSLHFSFYLENDGGAPDTLLLKGARGSVKLKAGYYRLSGGRKNYTAATITGRHRVAGVGTGDNRRYQLKVSPTRRVKGKRAARTFSIKLRSGADPGLIDVLRSKVKKLRR